MCVVLFYVAMNMELLLLLHEVEQMHSLVSPLRVPSAGPSVPPLILASVSASSFLASPLGFLQSLTQDILRFVFLIPFVSLRVTACHFMSLHVISCPIVLPVTSCHLVPLHTYVDEPI